MVDAGSPARQHTLFCLLCVFVKGMLYHNMGSGEPRASPIRRLADRLADHGAPPGLPSLLTALLRASASAPAAAAVSSHAGSAAPPPPRPRCAAADGTLSAVKRMVSN